MSFNDIRENTVLAKISGFTVLAILVNKPWSFNIVSEAEQIDLCQACVCVRVFLFVFVFFLYFVLFCKPRILVNVSSDVAKMSFF